MKRNLVLLSCLLVFGLLGWTQSALGQVVLGVSSNLNQARAEGIKEATGQVVLTSSSNGTIVGGAPGSQSIITVTYLANLAVAAVTANVSTTATCVSCFTVTGAVGQKVVTITFTANATVAAGNTFTISGIRVNANGFGTSGTILATAAAFVPAASASTNPITFSGTTQVPVANVNPIATTVSLSMGPSSILSCAPTGPPAFAVTVKEAFPQGLTSTADEVGLSGAGTAFNGSNIQLTFTGVPNGMGFTAGTPTFPASQTTLAVSLDTGSAATQTAATANASLTWVFKVTTTSTTAIESVTFPFTISPPTTLPVGLVPNSVTATVALTSFQTPLPAAQVPDFVGTEGAVTVLNISDCITNLLFPWLVADAPGGRFDTGIAFANTTKDVFTSGSAVPQSGSCTLTGFLFTTGAPVTPVVIGPIAAGQTGTVVLSTNAAFAGFRGYGIAVCQFQNAHAFAFITADATSANGTSQGYLALVIPNPALVKRNPAGGGAGEQLVH